MTSVDPSYIVFIRLPFPRGDFVDPPFVDWNASKDKQLWKVVSNASTNSDLDCSASKFNVPLSFLLQQVAWLYEQQMQQVQAQIRKVRVAVASTGIGSKSEHDEDVVRPGSGVPAARISSALAHRRESSNPTAVLSSGAQTSVERIAQGSPISVNTPKTVAPSLSRLSSTSTNTATTTLNAKQSNSRLSYTALSGRATSPKAQTRSTTGTVHQSRFSLSKRFSLSDSSSSDSLADPEISILSPVIRRPVRHTQKLQQSEQSQDDDEPAFMPFSSSEPDNEEQTLKTSSNDTIENTTNQIPISNKSTLLSDQTKVSSSQRHLALSKNLLGHQGHSDSPKRFPDIDERSLRAKGKNKEGSESTPSMSSSFSDLEDASVTQSALEEALASNMQAGGMASKMSTISQAIRSKYL
ncbi:hypothetical protein K3495_g14611 [Podosphaera aphanis]|nr:hypothetical protein K3495_g14611 [Podosphaera aphanis]